MIHYDQCLEIVRQYGVKNGFLPNLRVTTSTCEGVETDTDCFVCDKCIEPSALHTKQKTHTNVPVHRLGAPTEHAVEESTAFYWTGTTRSPPSTRTNAARWRTTRSAPVRRTRWRPLLTCSPHLPRLPSPSIGSTPTSQRRGEILRKGPSVPC